MNRRYIQITSFYSRNTTSLKTYLRSYLVPLIITQFPRSFLLALVITLVIPPMSSQYSFLSVVLFSHPRNRSNIQSMVSSRGHITARYASDHHHGQGVKRRAFSTRQKVQLVSISTIEYVYIRGGLYINTVQHCTMNPYQIIYTLSRGIHSLEYLIEQEYYLYTPVNSLFDLEITLTMVVPLLALTYTKRDASNDSNRIATLSLSLELALAWQIRGDLDYHGYDILHS